MNVERKLKAYVDKVEQKYDQFSVKDALHTYKKDVIHAFNEIDRSRSRSPKDDKTKTVRSKTSNHELDDESIGAAAKAPQFRKSMSHQQQSQSDLSRAKEPNMKKKIMSGMKGIFKFSKSKEEEEMAARTKQSRVTGKV